MNVNVNVDVDVDAAPLALALASIASPENLAEPSTTALAEDVSARYVSLLVVNLPKVLVSLRSTAARLLTAFSTAGGTGEAAATSLGERGGEMGREGGDGGGGDGSVATKTPARKEMYWFQVTTSTFTYLPSNRYPNLISICCFSSPLRPVVNSPTYSCLLLAVTQGPLRRLLISSIARLEAFNLDKKAMHALFFKNSSQEGGTVVR